MKTCAERPPVFAGIPTVPRATVGTAHLYQWQHEALSAWAESGCRGVVEAVTGTGKTLVGIAAAADALRDGGKVQVLVPTVELLRQWCRTLRKNLPGRRIGELGDGSDGGLPTSDVLVSVVNSARRYSPQHVPRNSLLVGDECHRYGSDSNAKALNPKFDRRLGLSANVHSSLRSMAIRFAISIRSLERSSIGLAIRERFATTSRPILRVASIGVRFTSAEEYAYREAARKCADTRLWLVQ